MAFSRSISLTAALLLAATTATHAAGDLSRQEPIEIMVELGKPGQHAFVPNKLRFETGKLYKLILRNPSSDPHYFTSHAFTQLIYTRKVQVVQSRTARRRRSPSSRAPSARSRSIPDRPPNGGSCRLPPGAPPICAAASSARTARATPTTAWWARS
jgi:hypothetical protein